MVADDKTEQKASFARRSLEWFADNWPVIANTLGGILTGLAAVWVSAPGFDVSKIPVATRWLLAVGILLILVGVLFQIRKSNILSSLRHQNEELNDFAEGLERGYPELMRFVLGSLFKGQLKLTHTERISIYRYDGNAFRIVGRFSQNPEYDQYGRALYPADQGCIAAAWREDKCLVQDVPDPTKNMMKYKEFMESRWGIPGNVVENMRMKSRFYAAFSLTSSLQQRPIGVVVIESTRTPDVDPKKALSVQRIERIMLAERHRLAQFLEIVGTFGPDLDYARTEGY